MSQTKHNTTLASPWCPWRESHSKLTAMIKCTGANKFGRKKVYKVHDNSNRSDLKFRLTLTTLTTNEQRLSGISRLNTTLTRFPLRIYRDNLFVSVRKLSAIYKMQKTAVFAVFCMIYIFGSVLIRILWKGRSSLNIVLLNILYYLLYLLQKRIDYLIKFFSLFR